MDRHVRQWTGERTMQATTRYAQRTFNGQAERLSAVVDGLPPDALTWRPGDETTNSIAQIVRHIYAWEPWYLGVALGEPVPLDDATLNQKQEDSLHNDPATAEELRSLVEAANAQTAAS